MAKQPKREELEDLAKQMNAVMGLEPPIKVTKKMSDEDLIEKIKEEAEGQIYESDFEEDPEDDEKEIFSKAAAKTLKALEIKVSESNGDDEGAEEAPEEEIEEEEEEPAPKKSKPKSKKEAAEEEEEVPKPKSKGKGKKEVVEEEPDEEEGEKPVKKGKKDEKPAKGKKAKEEEPEEEEEPAPKKGKKAAKEAEEDDEEEKPTKGKGKKEEPVKKGKKDEKPAKKERSGYTRSSAFVDALKEGGTKAEIVEAADKLFVKKGGGTTNITVSEALFRYAMPALLLLEVVKIDKKGNYVVK